MPARGNLFKTMVFPTPQAWLEHYAMPVPESGCWLFEGGLNTNGYGLLPFYGRTVAAHRASYTVFYGQIPAGLCVCHVCDVPSCMNPRHLWLGTISENKRDMVRKGRQPEHMRKQPRYSVTDSIDSPQAPLE